MIIRSKNLIFAIASFFNISIFKPFFLWLTNLIISLNKWRSKRTRKDYRKSKRYLKKLPEINRRLKRIINIRFYDINSQITQSYSILGYIVAVLGILWIISSCISSYPKFKNNVIEDANKQSDQLANSYKNLVKDTNNYLNYLSKKIRDNFDNKNYIPLNEILNAAPTSIISQRNISDWISIAIYDKDYNRIANNKNFEFTPTVKLSNYNLEKNEENINSIVNSKIYKMVSNSFATNYSFIPLSIKIESSEKKKIATLTSGIPLDQLIEVTKNGNFRDNFCYYAIDNQYNLLVKSDNSIYEKIIMKSSWSIKSIADNEKIFYGKFQENIRISNCKLTNFYKIEYGIIILTGYNLNFVLNEYKKQIIDKIYQSSVTALAIIIAFLLFKKYKIKPFVKEIFKARSQAQEADLIKSRFLSNMSHELRTPMNGILGMSQALRESKELSDEQRDQANVIYRCADGLLLILNDILSFSKIEAKKIDLELIDFNIETLIDDTAELMSQIPFNKGIEIITNIDPNIPRYILGDPARIRQIITNFINNSIKFTNHGYIYINIKLNKIEGWEYFIDFSVKDTGIGMEKETSKKIFNRFTQANISTNRKYGGTGLGLSICKELVETMGGRIGFESNVGIGSNFWFTIPAKKSPLITDEDTAQSTTKSFANKKIGLIDRNKIFIEAFKSKIENIIGGEVQFTNISQAIMNSAQIMEELISSAKNFDKDLFAIFINHNEIEGIDAALIAYHLKNSNLKNIPLIIMTSIKDRSQIKENNLEMFSSVILKPAKSQRIINSLLKLLPESNRDEEANISLKVTSASPVLAASKNIKILLCEDNEINMKVAKLIFKKIGATIDEAENGQEAINNFMHSKYDMILMDCMMPVLDGFQATEIIRKIEKEQKLIKTPIIALTANASEADKMKCLQAGMDDFISKPIKREDAEAIVERQLKK